MTCFMCVLYLRSSHTFELSIFLVFVGSWVPGLGPWEEGMA